MRIAIDCDGVLCDFSTAFLRQLTEVSGRALAEPDRFTRRFLPGSWNWPRDLGYTSREIDAAWRSTEDGHWWEMLTPLPGVSTFLTRLHEWVYDSPQHEVVFLTSRQRRSPFLKQQTERWLLEHGFRVGLDAFPPLPTVLVDVQHKGDVCHALGLDALVDDRPSHLAEARRACGPSFQTFLRAAPYNLDTKLDAETVVLHSLEDLWEHLS